MQKTIDFIKTNYFVFILFLIVGFSIYANSFVVPFFWDDNDNVVNNVYVKTWQYLPKYFSENLIAGAGLMSNYWRPLLLLNYSLDYHFFGLNKYWWHFEDILLHILNAFLIFLLLHHLIKKKWFAGLMSLIFLVHPVQAEAITMITSRADPLSLFFVLLALLFYVKDKYPIGRIILFALALLTKEIAIILPVLLVLIEICFPGERKPFRESFKAATLKVLPFFVLAGIYVLGRLTVLNFNNTLNFYNDSSLFATSVAVRFLSFLKALSIYYGLLIFPHNLHMERFFEPVAAIRPFLIFIFLLSLGLIIFSLWRFKKNKIYLFGIGWFFIALAPTSNILVPINRIIYEHWLYAPLIGFFVFLFAFFEEIFSALKKIFGWRSWLNYILIAVAAAYLIFLGWSTVNRNFDWENPTSFFNNVLKYNDKSLLAWNNLGMAYADSGDFEKAENAYQRAIALDAKNQSAPPHHNLGNLYKAGGKFNEAVSEYEKALNIDPKFFFSYNALLDLYQKTKNQEEFDKILERMRNL